MTLPQRQHTRPCTCDPGTPAQDTVAAVTRLSTVTPPGHLLILALSSCVFKVFTQALMLV